MRQNNTSPIEFTSSKNVITFGYRYSEQTQASTFFEQNSVIPKSSKEQLIQMYKEQNELLQQQLNSVKRLLAGLLRFDDDEKSGEDKTLDQLMKELLILIVNKSEENHTLKKMNESLGEDIQFYREFCHTIQSQNISGVSNCSRESLMSLKSNSINEPSESFFDNSRITNKPTKDIFYSHLRNSEDSTKTRSLYRPQVLFTLGKEVQTINELNSDSCIDINSETMDNFGPSFKKLMNLKRNVNNQNIRISIDGTIPQRRNSTQKTNKYGPARLRKLPSMARSTMTPQSTEEQAFPSKEESASTVNLNNSIFPYFGVSEWIPQVELTTSEYNRASP